MATKDPNLEGIRASLFKNGRSQAVRIPKAFRFAGKTVRIRRLGDALLLEPVRRSGWPKGFWQRLDRLRQGLSLATLKRPPDPIPRRPRVEL